MEGPYGYPNTTELLASPLPSKGVKRGSKGGKGGQPLLNRRFADTVLWIHPRQSVCLSVRDAKLQ